MRASCLLVAFLSTRRPGHGRWPLWDECPCSSAYAEAMAVGEQRFEELERVVDEQAALRRIATLVAEGATEADLANAVSCEIGGLFGAHNATVVRWDGDTIRVIGS